MLLFAWMLLLQMTGLGVPNEHQRHFCAIFGSQYLGSLASMGTMITLVLGLFISLVVSRRGCTFITSTSETLRLVLSFTFAVHQLHINGQSDHFFYYTSSAKPHYYRIVSNLI